MAININGIKTSRENKLNTRDIWRVVVRRDCHDARKNTAFLTLEELVNRTVNKQKD